MNKTVDDYFIVREKDVPAIVNFLDDKIYEFNGAMTTRKDASLFAYTVRDTDTTIIAGITGWTWAGACEITLFWIEERWRGFGIGTKLLGAAEMEAKNKECSKVLVRSYNFQAPFFYQKFGYRVEHILEDFPEGYKAYTLVKDLK